MKRGWFGSYAQYRFKCGTQVVCRTGPDEWSAGTIVQLNYSEAHWPPNKTVPYQVQLFEGPLIFVPADTEMLCKELKLPWWGKFLNEPASCYAGNPSAAELEKACGEKEDVNAKDHRGHVAIMEALRVKWLNGVETLLNMKADVNVVSSKKMSVLHFATTPSMMQMVLDAKADPNVQDSDPDYDPEFKSKTFGDRLEHRTPLHYACVRGDAESVSALIKSGAKLDIADAQFNTPLHLAIEEEHAAIISTLLDSKADVNLGNQESGMQNTPLMDAAHKGQEELAGQLIAANADINRQGKQGMGALHLAARRGDAKIAEMLIAAGADVSQKSQCGTPLELARKKKGDALLKAFGEESAPKEAPAAPAKAPEMDAAMRAALFLD
mmetsp:Transcript_68262/g.121734  ORF Transcript_68262/g.121734 Transcript_68262/m.121734 type:complete len:381 (+) Transcript_68262:49-1191(+)